MVDSTVGPDDVVALTITSPFRRRDAHEVSIRVRNGVDAGETRFVLDLTDAAPIDEAPLFLMLLGLRSALQRRCGRLVVASAPATARRLDASLRLDDVIASVASRNAAVTRVSAAGHAHRVRRDAAAFDQRFAATPANVAEARRLLATWLRAVIGGQDQLIADVIIATSEACNNAVLHAYRTSSDNGTGRSFRLTAAVRGAHLHIAVSDDGDGMEPRADSPGLGLGLPLIAALADAVDFHPSTGGLGTVVAMRFDGA